MHDAAHAPGSLLEHAAFVRRLAQALLLDPHAAEDVAQETWRAALEHPPRRAGEERGWLARVLRNFARRRRRADARRVERERSGAREEALPAAEASLERAETLRRVVDAVRALEEPYRATILARFYEGLAPRAIAARDGVPLETVRTRLKRGLARLREQLERDPSDWRAALGLLAGESPCLPLGTGSLVTVMQIKSLVALAAAVGLVAVLWNTFDGEPRAPRAGAPRGPGTAAGPAALAPPAEPAAGREPQPASRSEPVLSGRVIDERGSPVPEARVHVLGPEDPFGDEPGPDRIAWNAYRGRTLECDADGRWGCVLAAPREVLVVVEESETLERVPGAGDERWVTAPAEGVDFVLRRIPGAALEVRVLDGATREPLEDFMVAVYGRRTDLPGGDVGWEGGFCTRRAEEGRVRLELGIRDGDSRRVHVALREPSAGSLWNRLGFVEAEQPEQEVLLVPGATEEVVFVLPERGVLRGMVVDELGTPIPGALVFFGDEARARGDEPFKPLRFERIRDGARTGADGWFELRGEGPRVTAVHDDFSGATVHVARAGRIVLGARGAIRGRLLEADGRPAAGAQLRLDGPWDGGEGAPSATTDATGSFRFARVEAGAHALWREEGEVLLCVRVAPGSEVEVELRPGSAVPLELDIPVFAPPERAALTGVIVGLERTFGLCWIEDGTVAGHASPGRYWLATRDGIGAFLTVVEGEPRVRVEVGAARLVVRSVRRVNLQVAPHDADPFLRLMAARVWMKAEGETPARFRLHPGRYLLVGEAGLPLREVEVPSEGLELSLD